MNRLVAVLIIPLLALGHTFPHSHGNAYATDDHATAPHLHTGQAIHDHGDHHHGHSEESHAPEGSEPSDGAPVNHDADAVYLSGGSFYLHHKDEVLPHSAAVSVEDLVASDSFAAANPRQASSDGMVPFDEGPPIFLLHAALRL